MKTNQNGHTLRNLTNRVIAVIDDPRQTQAAVETLERAGVADRDLATFSGEEGARRDRCRGRPQRRRETRASRAAALDGGRRRISGSTRRNSLRGTTSWMSHSRAPKP